MGDASVGVRGGPDRPDGAGGVRETFVTSDGQTATTLNFFSAAATPHAGHALVWAGDFCFCFVLGAMMSPQAMIGRSTASAFYLYPPERRTAANNKRLVGWSIGRLVDWSIGRLIDSSAN